MKCDKCGFEHNSRSVCPKCGARVVYVNEDYLRRKKEWEEAQKKGQQSGPLPGITYSTREDYDRKRGRDTVTGSERMSGPNREGRHEDAGLPFDDIKDWVKKTRGRLAGFFDRQKKRRGADNPVIREINFNGDGGQENYDDTELVKIRRRPPRRKGTVIAAAAALVLLAAGVAAAIVFMRGRNADKSRVVIYDGKSFFFAGDEENPLIDGAGGSFGIDGVCGECFVAHDEGAVYVYGKGSVRTVLADSPRIIAYNGDMSLIVYETGGSTHILTAENDTEIELYKRGDFTDACAVSGSGKYFVLTTCAGGDDFTPGEYTVYFGDADGGLREIMRDYNEKEIICLRDDGRLVFSDMATADYGIINGRALSVWENDSDSVSRVIEDISALRYDGTGETVYCLTGSGELYRWGINEANSVLLDDGVSALCQNALYDTQGGVIYRKDSGFYLCQSSGGPRHLFDAECASPEFYFDYARNFLYYRDTGTVYYAAFGGKDAAPKSVCTLQSADSLLYYPQGKCLLAIASDGALLELGASQKQIAEGVSRVMTVENDGGVAYCTEGRLMYRENGQTAVTLSEATDGFDSIVFSRNKIYFRAGDKTAYLVSKDGSGIQSIGYAEYLFFIE